jgi:tetratricopeptide (TPR) repeat protein
MKRAERRHLKENELQRFAWQVRDLLVSRKRESRAVVAVLAVMLVVGVGYVAWRARVESRADALLAEALVVQEARVSPPGSATSGSYPTERARLQAAVTKFKAAADRHPSTDAGVFARYQEAAGQMALGNPAAAAAAYQAVMRLAGDGILGQMARLGLAEAHARTGQYDQAISAFKELAQRKDGPLPIDGILMQLGRTYRDAGKSADARQTFNRIVEEYPESPFLPEARRELEALKKT